MNKTWVFGLVFLVSIFIFPLVNGSYLPSTINNSLISVYNFNAGSGTVIKDSGLKEKNGTLTGGSWVTGVYGSAVNLVPTSYITIIAKTDQTYNWSAKSPRAITAWIKPKGAANTRVVWANSNGVGDAEQFYIRSGAGTADFQFGINNRTNQRYTRLGNIGWGTKTWKFISGSYDGTYLVACVNGVCSTTTLKSTISKVYAGAKIGALVIANTYPFNGSIDDLRIYNRSLTTSEIKQLFSCRTPANMSIWYMLGNCSITSITDTTPATLRITGGNYKLINGSLNVGKFDKDVGSKFSIYNGAHFSIT